jgi:hypothetical protein
LTGLVVVLACAAAAVSLRTAATLAKRLLITLLASAAALVPLEQARIHTTFSLHKHVDFGAWFAAIAAGYLVDTLVTRLRRASFRSMASAACAAAVIFPARTGVAEAGKLFHDWPNCRPLITSLRGIVRKTNGPILITSQDIPEYYLPQGAQWYRWSNLYSLRLLDGRVMSSGVIGQANRVSLYQSKIKQGFFSVVAVNLSGPNGTLYQQLLPTLEENRHYRMAVRVSYWHSEIWFYQPARRVRYNISDAKASLLSDVFTPSGRLSPLLQPITVAVEGSGLAALLFIGFVRLFWRRGKVYDEA